MIASAFLGLRAQAARHHGTKIIRPLAHAILARDLTRTRRLRLFYQPHSPICWSQIFPFFYYAKELAQTYQLSITAHPISHFIDGDPIGLGGGDVTLIQPWFTVDPQQLEAAIARYRRQNPQTKLVFCDSYAQADIRLAPALGDIDIYLKKGLFHDPTQFQTPFEGDTNLTQYYSRLYGIKADPVDWKIPDASLDKLDLYPNFLTAPYLIDGFMAKAPEFSFAARPIDLHSRIATKGGSWYSEMRQASDRAAKAIQGLRLTPQERIPRDEFLQEMQQAKLCWSPFGYGELCWRDLEAFMTGAVLIKPDMGHLRTRPDLYQPGVTYLPVEWDFSDLEEVVQGALAAPEASAQIAQNAFNLCRGYLETAQFVEDLAPLFTS